MSDGEGFGASAGPEIAEVDDPPQLPLTAVENGIQSLAVGSLDSDGSGQSHPLTEGSQEGGQSHPLTTGSLDSDGSGQSHPLTVGSQEGDQSRPFIVGSQEGDQSRPLAAESQEGGQSHPLTVGSQEGSQAPVPAAKGGLVDQLMKVLQQQHEVLCKQENVSRHFSGDVGRVAGRCWSQVHPHISEAVQGKYQQMMEEFGALEQLARMDRLKAKHSTSAPEPAWRPAGIPTEDSATAANAEAHKMVPEFETLYSEAQNQTHELQELLQQRREEMEGLETDIRTLLAALSSQPSGLCCNGQKDGADVIASGTDDISNPSGCEQ